VPKYTIAAVVSFVLFVVFGLVFTIQIFIHTIQQIESDSEGEWAYGYLFLLFYPLASALGPIFGLLAVMVCRPFIYKLFAMTNSLSLFTNSLSMFLCEMIFEVKGFYIYNIIFLMIT